MQWLVQLFALILGKIFTFFSSFVSKKTAQVVTSITLAGTVTAAFMAVLGSALGSIVVSAPSGLVASGLALLPGNTNACLAVVITVKAARWLYDWQVRVIQWSQV